MALLAIQEPGATLAVRRGSLSVLIAGTEVQTVRVAEIDEVHLYGGIELTAAARRKITRAGVDIVFFDAAGRFECRLVCAERPAGERRLAQLSAGSDEARRLQISRSVVAGKITNQRKFLQQANRSRTTEELVGAIGAMRGLLRRCDQEVSMETLLGLEGQAAALYFRGLASAITNPEFVFTERNRRPPRDPFNAMLSFGYALLASKVESAVRAAGLDPYVGVFHSASRGKPAMVLDLMEEFRAPIVDRLVLRLVNRRQVSPRDFENPDVDVETLSGDDAEQLEPEDPRPAVYLGRTGRAILIRELSHTWSTSHHVEERGGQFTMADIVGFQAFAMVRTFEDPSLPYQPWSLH